MSLVDTWSEDAVATAQAARTGAPLRLRAWHCSSRGGVKWGAGGAFFAEDPTTEYGDVGIMAELTFRNPLVTGDKCDAAAALDPSLVAWVEEKLDESASIGGDSPRIYAEIDAALARLARRAGHDGIVYLRPYSLSQHEYAALYKRCWRERGVDRQPLERLRARHAARRR